MAIRVCVAGATGWAGSAVTRKVLESRGCTKSQAARFCL